MKKYVLGTCVGVFGAIINIVPLFFAPGLDIKVYLSTAVTWAVIGFLTSACDLKTKGWINGIIVALLVSAPTLIFTFASSLSGALWSMASTIIVGGTMGYFIKKVATSRDNETSRKNSASSKR